MISFSTQKYATHVISISAMINYLCFNLNLRFGMNNVDALLYTI